jgi:DNA repair protein RecO (recombination protein O)
MLYKTRGIVLHHSPYNDTHNITLIYTEGFGRVSYLTTKSGSRKTKVPHSLFHPLAVLDLEVEHKDLREIQRIKEAKLFVPLFSVLCSPVKSAICIFLAELIYKVVREVHADKALFGFFLQSVQILDLTEKNCANFHLAFLVGFSRFLGLYPDASGYRKGLFFDLRNAAFVSNKPSHINFLNPDESLALSRILRLKYGNMHVFRFSGNERKAIINHILEYYRLHLANFSEIKSIQVLHEVFE